MEMTGDEMELLLLSNEKKHLESLTKEEIISISLSVFRDYLHDLKDRELVYELELQRERLAQP